MENKINIKWFVDTILEGLLLYVPIIVLLPIIATKTTDDSFEFYGFNHIEFIVLVCSIAIFSFLSLCYYKYKKINNYSMIAGGGYGFIIGFITHFTTRSWNITGAVPYHLRDSSCIGSELYFYGLIYILIAVILSWLITQYKRFDFEK